MIALSAEEASRALEVQFSAGAITGVSTDTRHLHHGDVFVALVGDKADGHAFVPAAFEAGASAAIVERGRPIGTDASWEAPRGDALCRVPDTLRALGMLAREVRRKSKARVIGVTGSVGKTGTKDLIRALAGSVLPVLATEANLNNQVGAPSTLLRLDASIGVAVIEMGMRGRGEIAFLAEVAEPDVGLVTKLAPAHLEFLGSMEEIARAKGELLQGLQPGGVAVIPAGSPLLEHQASVSARRTLRFALCTGEDLPRSPTIDVWGEFLPSAKLGGSRLALHWPGGAETVELPFSSPYRLENTVAAVAACCAADLPVSRCLAGLADVPFTPSRGDEVNLGGILLLDDCYNANPTSMTAALDWLVLRAKEDRRRPVAILGDMLELGPNSEAYHREVGHYAAAVGVQLLWAAGQWSEALVEGFNDAKPSNGVSARSISEAELDGNAPSIVDCIEGGDAVLVKASHAMGFERVVAAIRAAKSGLTHG